MGRPCEAQTRAEKPFPRPGQRLLRTDEIGRDDVRFEMLLRLLERTGPEELAAAEPVAAALAAATGLPPFQYTGPNALHVGANPAVWARNLLANRFYGCPSSTPNPT